MSDDLVKLSIEILDLGLDRYSEEELFSIGDTTLGFIARHYYRPNEGCSNDKWLSYLRKIEDRFPVDILSTQDRDGHTPYDCLINNSPLWHDEKWYEEVLDIFKPR